MFLEASSEFSWNLSRISFEVSTHSAASTTVRERPLSRAFLSSNPILIPALRASADSNGTGRGSMGGKPNSGAPGIKKSRHLN